MIFAIFEILNWYLPSIYPFSFRFHLALKYYELKLSSDFLMSPWFMNLSYLIRHSDFHSSKSVSFSRCDTSIIPSVLWIIFHISFLDFDCWMWCECHVWYKFELFSCWKIRFRDLIFLDNVLEVNCQLAFLGVLKCLRCLFLLLTTFAMKINQQNLSVNHD